MRIKVTPDPTPPFAPEKNRIHTTCKNPNFYDRCLTAYQEAAHQTMISSSSKPKNKESKTPTSIDDDLLIFKTFLNSSSPRKFTLFTGKTLLDEFNEYDRKLCERLVNSKDPKHFCSILTCVNKENVSSNFRTFLIVFFSMTPHWRKYLGKEILDFIPLLHHFLSTKDCEDIGEFIYSHPKYINKFFYLPNPEDESFDIIFNSLIENLIINDNANLLRPKLLKWLPKIPKDYSTKFANTCAQQFEKLPTLGSSKDHPKNSDKLVFTISLLPWMDIKHHEIVFKAILFFSKCSSDGKHIRAISETIIKIKKFQTIIPQNILFDLITDLNKELDTICSNLHSVSDYSEAEERYYDLIMIDRTLNKLKSKNMALKNISSGLNQSFFDDLIKLIEDKSYPHKNLIFNAICQLSIYYPKIMDYCIIIFSQLLRTKVTDASKRIHLNHRTKSYIFKTLIHFLETGISLISPQEVRNIILALHKIKSTISKLSFDDDQLFIYAAIERVYSKMRTLSEAEKFLTTKVNLPITIFNIISEYLKFYSDSKEAVSETTKFVNLS